MLNIVNAHSDPSIARIRDYPCFPDKGTGWQSLNDLTNIIQKMVLSPHPTPGTHMYAVTAAELSALFEVSSGRFQGSWRPGKALRTGRRESWDMELASVKPNMWVTATQVILRWLGILSCALRTEFQPELGLLTSTKIPYSTQKFSSTAATHLAAPLRGFADGGSNWGFWRMTLFEDRKSKLCRLAVQKCWGSFWPALQGDRQLLCCYHLCCSREGVTLGILLS